MPFSRKELEHIEDETQYAMDCLLHLTKNGDAPPNVVIPSHVYIAQLSTLIFLATRAMDSQKTKLNTKAH